MAGGVGNTPQVAGSNLTVASSPATLPEQNRPAANVEAAAPKAPPAPPPAGPTHDPAVTIAPSIAAATVGLKPGDELTARVIAADSDGRPVLQTEDGVFIADTVKTWPVGTKLDIAIADVGHEVAVALLAENDVPLPAPQRLELILVQLPDSAASADTTQPPSGAPSSSLAGPGRSATPPPLASPAGTSPAVSSYRPLPLSPGPSQIVQNFRMDGEDLSILTSAARFTPPSLPPVAASQGGAGAASPAVPGAVVAPGGPTVSPRGPGRLVAPGRWLDLAPGEELARTSATGPQRPVGDTSIPAKPAASVGAGPVDAGASEFIARLARSETSARLTTGQYFTARVFAAPPDAAVNETLRTLSRLVGGGQAELMNGLRLPEGQPVEISLQTRPQAAASGPALSGGPAYARPLAAAMASPPADFGPRQVALTGVIVAMPSAPGASAANALATPVGLLMAPELAALPPGAVITIGVRLPATELATPPLSQTREPQSALTAGPTGGPVKLDLPLPPEKLMQNWPALGQIAAILQQQNPAFAASLADRLPGLNSRLTRNLAFYFLTARADAGGWLGTEAATALIQAGQGVLIEQLKGELSGRAAAGPDGQWQALTLPFDLGERVIAVPLFVRPFQYSKGDDDAAESSGGGRSGTRFLLDLNLSRLGAMQIDGLVQSRRLDIVLRSGAQLPPAIRQGIAGSFYRALDGQGLTGNLTFRDEPLPMGSPARPGLASTLKI